MKFYVLTFVNELPRLILQMVNFRKQRKNCIAREIKFCDSTKSNKKDQKRLFLITRILK